jgi:hypothetical protein
VGRQGQAGRGLSGAPSRRGAPADPSDVLPDVRDGLTRKERVVLWQLSLLERERRGSVPTAQLYGRVVEHVDMSVEELQRILARLVGGR